MSPRADGGSHGLSELRALSHLSSRNERDVVFSFRKKTPELEAMARPSTGGPASSWGRAVVSHGSQADQASGREKQRVALGRCITRDPALFLLDEPFSNLDQALRRSTASTSRSC